MDATVDEGGRLNHRRLSDETRSALGLDDEEVGTDPALTVDDPAPAEGGPDRPRRRRTLWSDLGHLVSTPARRGRLAIGLAVLAVAVTGAVLARQSVSDARVEVRAQAAERSGAADERASIEAAEAVATDEAATGADLAAQARAAHNEQRRRLAAIELNEQTLPPFLVQVEDNAAYVEYRRDETTAEVDRQAMEIPQMQDCVRVAQTAINAAWNTAHFGVTAPPAPAEVCRSLMAAGTR